MKYLFLLLFFFVHFVYAIDTLPKHNTINIGILSFRDIDENQQAWKPLEDYLNNHNQAYQFKIHSYLQDDLEKAVAKNELDIIFVYPLVSVIMETKYHTHNIASIVRKDPAGKLLNSYGSTIVVKADRDDINSLKDLNDKTIAIPVKTGFVTYLIPKEMLNENGIDFDKDCKLLITGQPMYKVWEALNSGKADVGIFKTGYLEEMISKGNLKGSDFKVINPQRVDGFDYMLSSKLYPEWAVAATNHATPEEIKIITMALYSIKDSNCSEYDSFAVPSSYIKTRELMQKYHIYPFDKVVFNFSAFIKEYIIFVIIFMFLLLLFSWYFVYYYVKTSKKIEEDRKQLNTILTTASDGIHVHDKNGKFLFFSDTFHNMLGYTREEMVKLTVFDLEKKITPERIVFMINDVVKNKKNLRFESQHQKKDGTKIDIELIINSITVNGKDCIYAVSRDITEIKKQRELLKQQKEEFETIFETTKDGIAVLDLESNFLKVNQAYTEITGLSKEELLQTSCIALTIQEDIEKSKQIFRDIAQEIDIEDFEKTCVIKERKIIVKMSLSLMPDKKHILVSIKNISHQKLFEAQSKLASLGEMIGNITHQWRQPLSIISTLSSGISFREEMDTLKDYKHIKEDMETIVTQTTYLSRTIDDFKNFIRGDLSKTEVNTKRLVEKTISIVYAEMKKNNISVILNDNGGFIFEGFENELIQAFINIINNAKDAITENLGVEMNKYIFINISNEKDKYIEFIDNGGGIPLDVLPKIFTPYFTTKGEDIGTGIGLSMTYQIITEHHNATIEASNKEYEYNGKQHYGACFRIVF